MKECVAEPQEHSRAFEVAVLMIGSAGRANSGRCTAEQVVGGAKEAGQGRAGGDNVSR